MTNFPKALGTAAFVLETYCRTAPPLYRVEISPGHDTALATARLQVSGDNLVDILDWAGTLGGRLRLYRSIKGDLFELAAVREIDGVAFEAWTLITAEQADAVLRLMGGEYDQRRRAWLDVSEDTGHGIRLALLAVPA